MLSKIVYDEGCHELLDKLHKKHPKSKVYLILRNSQDDVKQ